MRTRLGNQARQSTSRYCVGMARNSHTTPESNSRRLVGQSDGEDSAYQCPIEVAQTSWFFTSSTKAPAQLIHYLVDMSSLLTDGLFGVKGYVAVVTGGASGLGFMIARVGASLKLQLHILLCCYSLTADFVVTGACGKWRQGIPR
jgi:hypothetical protein